MDASDYTPNQKKLIKGLYPDKYAELWPEETKKEEPDSSVEAKKEEEPAAE